MNRIFLTFVFLFLLAAAARSDLKERRIPDIVSAGIMLTGIAAVWWMPETGIWQRITGMLAVSVPLLIVTMIKQGAFGGGDIKLLAAGGLFLGADAVLEAFFIAMTAAGLYGIVLLMKGKGRKKKFALGTFFVHGDGVQPVFRGIFVELISGKGLYKSGKRLLQYRLEKKRRDMRKNLRSAAVCG